MFNFQTCLPDIRMHNISKCDLFPHCFREPSLKGVDMTIGVKDDNAAKDDLYGLVNGVNEDLYGYLSKSKESRI